MSIDFNGDNIDMKDGALINAGAIQIAGGPRCVSIDWGLDSTYQTIGSSFAELGFNATVGDATDYYDTGLTTIKGIVIAMVSTDAGATGELDVYNYTDGVALAGSVIAIADNQTYNKVVSAELTFTQGKTYRIRMRRVTGNKKVKIQSASIIAKIE